MTGARRSNGAVTVGEAPEALKSTVEGGGVGASIHDDGSGMTPMLVVEFDRTTDRAEVFRALFHADGPVAADSVHAHCVVVREA